MKNGFSMIELIFVIVVLGILAAVAIPKISEARDEAIQAETTKPVDATAPKDNSFPNIIYTAPKD
jgi:prepilin-type N-terminal cleavage/methylation domain-containing protein